MSMPAIHDPRGENVHGIPAADGRVETRVFLQPIAAPSILGLFGFMGATLMVGANMAGWFGTPLSPKLLFPFALFFGGVAQFLAGMWAYKARDGVATAAHGTWGSFWLGYGLLWLLISTHVLPAPVNPNHIPELGWWFIVLAAVTWLCAFASAAESLGIFGVLSTLAAGSTLAAIGLNIGNHTVNVAAGWVFVVSAAIAWYVAGAMMLESAAGRTILPLFKFKREANIPGKQVTYPIEYEWAEPGVRKGQ